VAEVWSRVLGEAVVFASDNARLDPGELWPVYRAHELRVLLGLTAPGELRRIHEVKKTSVARSRTPHRPSPDVDRASVGVAPGGP
jgi:hypothetical protein